MAYDYENATPGGAARDASGNIYIAGVTRGSSTNGNICLLKYKPNGDMDWVKTYGEPGKNFAALRSIAIDDSQNVYACGEAESSSCFAVRIVKYRPNSPRVDTIRYTLRGYSELDGGDFHILGNGEAYLALSVEHPTRWADWLTVKLSRQGWVLWERIYKDTDSTWEQLCWSQVDERANIYLTGIVTGPTYQSQAAFCTMKMDSSGNVLWTREYNGPENLRDEPRFLMLKSGYVYVAGWSVYKEMGENQATALVKYDSLGNQQWASRYGSADTDADEGYEFFSYDQPDFRSINVDDSGSVYLTGYLCDRGGVVGILLQYDPQGNLVRVRKLSAPGERWFGAIVDVDSAGAIYDVGVVPGGGRIDVFVVKYRGRQR